MTRSTVTITVGEHVCCDLAVLADAERVLATFLSTPRYETDHWGEEVPRFPSPASLYQVQDQDGSVTYTLRYELGDELGVAATTALLRVIGSAHSDGDAHRFPLPAPAVLR